MGGPCCIDGTCKATNNFAIVQAGFTIGGVTYYSAEHAYQALKMAKKEEHDKIAALTPKKNESAWDHGMRCWNAGQKGELKKSWHTDGSKLKIKIMYQVTKAKLEQCQEPRDELCGIVAAISGTNGTQSCSC
jgi:predicted NAD-dependent protein-ADP-ribosyltransferase YbiA (DUF1768 family)